MSTSLPHHHEQSIGLPVQPEEVFQHLDDFEQLGAHMSRSSWMMAGSRMRYEFDDGRGKEVGVRLVGAMLGVKLKIEEQVVERTPPVSKTWHTIGTPRMIVLDAYRMGFAVTPLVGGCRVRVFIDYTTAGGKFGQLLGRLGGAPYARWCVRSMIDDATRRFGRRVEDR